MGISSGAAPGAYGTPFSPPTPAADSPSPTGPGAGGFATPPPTSGGGAGFDPGFGGGQFAALDGGGLAIADNAGYIDSAIIRSRIRMRYDLGYGLTSPDRGEFFYAKCGCFALRGTLRDNPSAFDPRANGPVPSAAQVRRFGGNATEVNVDYQEFLPYFEYAASERFSVFTEVPIRFINPTINDNAAGFSDMNVGFKYALVASPDRFYTFQMRVYVPTGDSDQGLGTRHASFEPGLLVFQRLSDRLFLHAEVRDWIPIRGTDHAGNILRYGLGLSYNAFQTDSMRIAPVGEVVGWTLLDGRETDALSPEDPATLSNDAGGDTIVNGKFGIRIGFGEYGNAGGGSSLNDRSSLFLGYARALTGDHWYRDGLRLEYNYYF